MQDIAGEDSEGVKLDLAGCSMLHGLRANLQIASSFVGRAGPCR